MTVEQAPAEVEEARPVWWGMGDALAGNVLSLALSIVGVTVAVAVLGWQVEGQRPLGQVALLQIPLWAGLVAAPLWATHLKGRRSLRHDFGFWMRWTDVPVGVAAGIAGQFLLAVILAFFYDLFGVDLERVGETAQDLAAAADDVVGVALLVAVVVVAAPLSEELFYRGLWLRAAERRFGPTAAVILTSVVFGLVHFQLYDLPALIGIALVFALLTVWTGRLGPAIWAHVAFNATTVVSLLLS